MAHKLYTGIRDKVDNASIVTLMSASNIFGRGLSYKKFELIMHELPDILISDETNEQRVVAVENIKGMARKTAEAFVEKIEDFKTFLKEASLEDKLYEDDVKLNIDFTHPLYNKTICMTGTRDKRIMELLQKVGAVLGNTVSKNTFLVIAKTKEEDTGKAEEARKLGIDIMTPNEFMSLYGPQ